MTPPPPTLPDLTPDEAWSALRAEAVEQLMRVKDTENLLLRLLDVPDATAAASAVGAVLSVAPVPLTPGCPLLSLGAGRALDDAWRRWYPPQEGSLYTELLFCRALSGADPTHPVDEFPDAYAELEHLRVRLGFPDPHWV